MPHLQAHAPSYTFFLLSEHHSDRTGAELPATETSATYPEAALFGVRWAHSSASEKRSKGRRTVG